MFYINLWVSSEWAIPRNPSNVETQVASLSEAWTTSIDSFWCEQTAALFQDSPVSLHSWMNSGVSESSHNRKESHVGRLYLDLVLLNPTHRATPMSQQVRPQSISPILPSIRSPSPGSKKPRYLSFSAWNNWRFRSYSCLGIQKQSYPPEAAAYLLVSFSPDRLTTLQNNIHWAKLFFYFFFFSCVLSSSVAIKVFVRVLKRRNSFSLTNGAIKLHFIYF